MAMSDVENDSDISFFVKFLGRLEVVRSAGMEILIEASTALQTEKKKKDKVYLFLSRTSIDILEHKTKFQSKLFAFVAKHPALDTHHCYVFQSTKFSHLLVSVMGDAFQSVGPLSSMRGSRDLVVEALRHKNKVLKRENSDLRKKLEKKGGV